MKLSTMIRAALVDVVHVHRIVSDGDMYVDLLGERRAKLSAWSQSLMLELGRDKQHVGELYFKVTPHSLEFGRRTGECIEFAQVQSSLCLETRRRPCQHPTLFDVGIGALRLSFETAEQNRARVKARMDEIAAQAVDPLKVDVAVS